MDPIDIRPLFSVGFAGEAQIGIGPNSDGPLFGSVPLFQFVSVPKNHYVYVEVTGTVTGVDSEECEGTPQHVGSWNAWGIPGTSSGLSVDVPALPITHGYGTAVVIKRGAFTADTALYAKRNPYFEGCTEGAHIDYSGSQTIAYEVFPFFEVSASPPVVQQGDTITFTATSHWGTWEEGWVLQVTPRVCRWEVAVWGCARARAHASTRRHNRAGCIAKVASTATSMTFTCRARSSGWAARRHPISR